MDAGYTRSRRLVVGELELHVSENGPEEGPPVILIHGWPDTARLWRNQAPALAGSGYRVVAPDVRGFGRSSKPEDISDYHLSRLSRDFAALIEDLDADTVHVVGHDWGAAIGWYLALTMPDRLSSLTALSVGHPSAFRRAGFRQLEKSWYMLLFQFEGFAERWLSDDDWRNFRAFAGGHAECEAWVTDLSEPGALRASLAVYRANMAPERLLAPPLDLPPVDVPVLGVWSTDDMALLETQMTESARYVAGEFRYERIDDASHWIPLDAPEELNELLLSWLGNRSQ